MAPPERVQRLIITGMELENFKSYAGVQHIGPFHKFFTSVVGPNGSGKSNVIDALLFVFGFKASRIRLKRIGELVHSSTKFPDLTVAKVTVRFTEILDKEGDDYDEVPGTQFAISRTAHVDNKSEYFVNTRKSTFAEITTMLKEKGIDLDHNRFLILQGEVEAISLMPPKARTESETGMLEYLEDIIGTAGYKGQIEAATKAVDELNEQRESILNLVKASQKERDSLQGAKGEAEAFLRVETDFIRAQSLSHQLTALRLQKRRVDCAQKLEALRGTAAEYHADLQARDAELKTAEDKWKAFKQESDKKEKALKLATDMLAKLERTRTELQENTKNAAKKQKKVSEGIKKDETALRVQQNALEQAQRELQQSQKEVAEGRPALRRLEVELDKAAAALEVQLKPLRKALEKKKEEVRPHRQKLAQADSDLQVSESERTLLLSSRDQLSKRGADEEAACGALRAELTRMEADGDAWAKTKLKLEKDQKQLTKDLEGAAQQRSQAEAAYREAVRRFEELRSHAAAEGNPHRVVEFLMKHKKNGNLPGIYGRLGDLGAIDAKYDVAVSTACPQLNYVVVQDVATGQRCFDLLREHDAGRCTAIILEKQQHLQGKANAGINPPEGVKRLFDLITIKDQRFRVAFYWALSDTLVAENVDQATRIAFAANKRWRVVTLDGKLIETSGTMSGGGAPQKGLMSGQLREEVDPQALRRLEEEVGRLKQQLDAAAAREEQLQGQIRDSQRALEGGHAEALKRQALTQGKKQALVEAEARLASLRAQLQKGGGASEAAAVAKLDTEIARQKAACDAIRASMAAMEEAVTSVEAEMEDVGGVEFKSLKHRVQSLAHELDEKEKLISKLQVNIKTAEQNAKKLEAKIVKDKKELQGTDAQDSNSKDRLDQSEKEYLKLKQAQDVLRAEAQAVQGDGESLREELAQAKKNRAVLQTKGVDLEHKVKQNEAELHKMDAELKTLDKRVDDLDAQLLKNVREYGADFLQGLTDDPEDLQTQSQRPAGDEEGGDEDDGEEQRPAKGRKRKAPPKVALPPLAKRKRTEAPTTRVDPERLQEYDPEKVRYDVNILNESLTALRPNLQVLVEWREKDADYRAKVDRLDHATQARNDRLKECEGLKKQRLTQFMKAFHLITMKLKEMYQMLTLGGDADLELVDNLDPFSEGIVFSVRPNKKAWKQIANLSGGEKTLSSLALVFALHHYQPSPLYVLDEIDAALDFKNVSIVAHYIKEQAVNAQFIIISLRNNMFELADRLVGIYKTQDCTRSVAINPHTFLTPAAP